MSSTILSPRSNPLKDTWDNFHSLGHKHQQPPLCWLVWCLDDSLLCLLLQLASLLLLLLPLLLISMAFVNQLLDRSSTEITSFQEQLSRLQTQSDFTSTRFGKQPHLMSGSTTAVLSSSLSFTSSSVSTLTWDANGNLATG